MTRRHHVVLVIGGGPAGSAAAHTLASQGVDVCLIDKAVFPRDKLCGGLLTLRSRKLFAQIFGEADWAEAFEFESAGARLLYRDRLLNAVDKHGSLYFTCRRHFDNYLLSLAQRRGAVIRQGDAVAAIDLTNKVCRLASGDEIAYDYLIGADGVNSMVARTLFGQAYDRSTIAFALEMDVSREQLGRDLKDPEIYFGVVKWGYGWAFPKQDTVTLGVGGVQARNPNMKRAFERFLVDLCGAMPSGKMKGHHIPCGDYKRHPGSEPHGVLLVGDAAGLVDPITGEGIAHAMHSGHNAGLAVVAHRQSGGAVSVLKAYQRHGAEITQSLDHARWLRYLIYPEYSEKLLVRMLPRSGQLMRRHLDLMAGEVSYGDYARYIGRGLFKSLVRGRLF